MAKPYYTMFEFEAVTYEEETPNSVKSSKNQGRWVPQFGDYERSVVKEEMQAWKEDSSNKFCIVRTETDTQEAIEEARAKLNGKKTFRQVCDEIEEREFEKWSNS